MFTPNNYTLSSSSWFCLSAFAFAPVYLHAADIVSTECYGGEFCVYVEQDVNKLNVFFESQVNYPITLTADMKLTNLVSPVGNTFNTVLEPGLLTESLSFELKGGGTGTYNFTFSWNRGDSRIPHDSSTTYFLPYADGLSYSAIYGYDETRLISNSYGMIFDMPFGSAVHAARSGTVVEV